MALLFLETRTTTVKAFRFVSYRVAPNFCGDFFVFLWKLISAIVEDWFFLLGTMTNVAI